MNASAASPEISQERPTVEELKARAEALVPVLKERAREAEELRRVPDETIDDLEQAGLFYICSPREYGGYGYGEIDLGEVTRILAHGCASTAWVYHFMVFYNIQIAQDIPRLLGGEPFVRAALSAGAQLAPSGKAVPVEGGWMVSGRWPYASAILHARYLLLVTVEEPPEDGPTAAPPKVLGLVCEAADAEILDDWNMAGMAATGSNTFELHDVFIPAEQEWTMWGGGDPDAPEDEQPPAKFTVIGGFGILLAGCAVGAVEGAVEEFADRIHKRITPLNGGPQREHREAWGRYGEAVMEVRVARLIWQESLRMIDDFAKRAVKPSRQEAAMLKMATARMAKAAADALEIVIEGSGTSIYRLDEPLQRTQRDVAVIKSHALMAPDSAYVPSGQVLLDLGEPSDPMFRL